MSAQNVAASLGFAFRPEAINAERRFATTTIDQGYRL